MAIVFTPVTDDSAALVSGHYRGHMLQQDPAGEATDPDFQDRLLGRL